MSRCCGMTTSLIAVMNRYRDLGLAIVKWPLNAFETGVVFFTTFHELDFLGALCSFCSPF